METKDYLDKLFYPKSIAMIEVNSRRQWQIAGTIGLRGTENVHLVSRDDEKIQGIKCHRDITDLPDKIDHAIIAVNRKRLKDTIQSCIEKQFYTLHIFTAGGAEQDEMGREIEEEVRDLIKNNDIRAIGPNCMGVYSTGGKISYNPRFSGIEGKLAFVSQSGDITSQFIQTQNFNGVYFSNVASIGNSIDLTISDFIEYFNSDGKTEIIGVYFEGFPRFDKTESKRFWEALKKNKKPLFLLRGGVSKQGKKAAMSHTGTIATDDNIWESIYKQTSALKVETYEDLIDSTIAMSFCKNLIPNIKSLVLITWSGGKAVLSTDRLVELGIDVPEIVPETQKKLQKLISIGNIKNPLDLPWISREEKYPEICKLAINEDYLGGVILETGTWDKLDERFDQYYKNLLEIYDFTKQKRKPFLLSLPYTFLYKQREKFKKRLIKHGFPVFPSIIRAARAFLTLYNYQRKSNLIS